MSCICSSSQYGRTSVVAECSCGRLFHVKCVALSRRDALDDFLCHSCRLSRSAPSMVLVQELVRPWRWKSNHKQSMTRNFFMPGEESQVQLWCLLLGPQSWKAGEEWPQDATITFNNANYNPPEKGCGVLLPPSSFFGRSSRIQILSSDTRPFIFGLDIVRNSPWRMAELKTLSISMVSYFSPRITSTSTTFVAPVKEPGTPAISMHPKNESDPLPEDSSQSSDCCIVEMGPAVYAPAKFMTSPLTSAAAPPTFAVPVSTENMEESLARIQRCLQGVDGVSAVGDSITVSLKCPLTGSTIRTVARFKQCTHILGFDLEALMEMNKVTKKWQCPHCLREYGGQHELVVDALMDKILRALKEFPEEVKDVEVRANGSWRPKLEWRDDVCCLSPAPKARRII